MGGRAQTSRYKIRDDQGCNTCHAAHSQHCCVGCRGAAGREPKTFRHKEGLFISFPLFLYILSLYEVINVNQTSCGHHFTIYLSHTILL